MYLSRGPHLAFFWMAIAMTGFSMVNGPLFATIQSVIPPHMRATAIAIIYLFSNLVGLGLGPLAAGALSDALRPFFGEDSLRYALLILAPGFLWVSAHLRLAGRTVAVDLDGVRSTESILEHPDVREVKRHRRSATPM